MQAHFTKSQSVITGGQTDGGLGHCQTSGRTRAGG